MAWHSEASGVARTDWLIDDWARSSGPEVLVESIIGCRALEQPDQRCRRYCTIEMRVPHYVAHLSLYNPILNLRT